MVGVEHSTCAHERFERMDGERGAETQGDRSRKGEKKERREWSLLADGRRRYILVRVISLVSGEGGGRRRPLARHPTPAQHEHDTMSHDY